MPYAFSFVQSHGVVPPQWSHEQAFFMGAHVQWTAYFFGSALNLSTQAWAQK